MSTRLLLCAALIAAAAPAFAATPAYLIVDHSSAAVMDKATALGVWKENLPALRMKRLAKLYPVSRYGFVSQVEGGFTEGKTCVVAARTMLVPRKGPLLAFSPTKSAMTFDAQPGLTVDQCKGLAKTKLNEAIGSVTSSLVKD